MLSDEEIISLNRMKLFARSSDLSIVTAKDMDIVVTLVEKQSKEIEELKEEECCMTTCLRKDKEKLFLEDKIKAKIEYYEKIDNPVGKRVLQSLLEKE